MTNFERLKFYREELKYEYAMLANKLALYVTSQAFLVGAFASLCASTRFPATVWLAFAVAILGLAISLLIRIPISLEQSNVQKWLELERKLLRSDTELSLAIFGDVNTPGSYDDRQAGQSLHFSTFGPIVFICLWLILIVGTLARLTLKL